MRPWIIIAAAAPAAAGSVLTARALVQLLTPLLLLHQPLLLHCICSCPCPCSLPCHCCQLLVSRPRVPCRCKPQLLLPTPYKELCLCKRVLTADASRANTSTVDPYGNSSCQRCPLRRMRGLHESCLCRSVPIPMPTSMTPRTPASSTVSRLAADSTVSSSSQPPLQQPGDRVRA